MGDPGRGAVWWVAGLVAAWLVVSPPVDGAPLEGPAAAPRPAAVKADADPLLVLDPQRALLTLYQRGAILREVPVAGIEIGALRSAAVDAAVELVEPWTDGRIEPRREVARLPVVISDGSGPAVEVPPTPEEIYPAPACFAIRFAARRALEVSSASDRTRRSGAAACRGTTSGPRDRLRVRVTVDPEDAAELYRSMPSEIVLWWVGEGGAAPPPA